MCDFQVKLVAWLDQELTRQENDAVERHIQGCPECARRVATYQRVSQTFDSYCNAVMVAGAPRRSRWVPALAPGLIAALVCLALLRTRVAPPPVIKPAAAVASRPAPVQRPVAKPIRHKPMLRRHQSAPDVHELRAAEPPMEAAVEIAIPAEAMFPPGAVPNGVNFIGDLRIAPDGSVKQVRLRQ